MFVAHNSARSSALPPPVSAGTLPRPGRCSRTLCAPPAWGRRVGARRVTRRRRSDPGSAMPEPHRRRAPRPCRACADRRRQRTARSVRGGACWRQLGDALLAPGARGMRTRLPGGRRGGRGGP
ncbi:hypothetical protein QJS66_07055 [Kocuria rhizophila]|nr:hypothetical protein QJS66_07055 [Kocuria rhizophila]